MHLKVSYGSGDIVHVGLGLKSGLHLHLGGFGSHLRFELSDSLALGFDSVTNRLESQFDNVLYVLPFVLALEEIVDHGWSVGVLPSIGVES